MEYLFFDIECANCFDGVGKMCEFGYVVTDERLNVIEQDNIIINPETEFDKKGFAMSKIKLSLPYKKYYKTAPFSKVYERIRELFVRCEIAVGHNTFSDNQYLLDACRRYNLAPFNYEYMDTVKVARTLLNREKNLRLIELYNDFCISEKQSQRHSGIDDALMTKELAKFLLATNDTTISQLKKTNPEFFGEVFMGRTIEYDTDIFRLSSSNKMTNKKNKDLFDKVLSNMPKSKVRYCFPLEYERNHFRQMVVIVNRLKELGLGYTQNPNNAHYVTLTDNEERLKFAKKERTLSLTQFLSSINLSSDDLVEPNIENIIASLPSNKEWYEHYIATHSQKSSVI